MVFNSLNKNHADMFRSLFVLQSICQYKEGTGKLKLDPLIQKLNPAETLGGAENK